MVTAKRDSQRRMAFLGTLAGGLAHEIRNPLSTMKVNLQMLRDDLAKDGAAERSARRVDVLEQAVRRLESIVDDFLNYARGFELRIEPTDLNRVVAEVVVFVEPEAQRHGVSLRTAYAADLPAVPVDRKYLQQALLNLLLNARQAIESSGKTGEIFVTTQRSGKQAWIVVTDTGPGIAAEVLPRIFDVYFSTKKGGTGLGLPTTKRIIEEHGGAVRVESELGKGTSFRLELPLTRRDGTSDATSS
jgi:two-component system, NtrC family, sensor histidine kinase HydH